MQPGGQAYAPFTFSPSAVLVTNKSKSVAGAIAYAWIYPSTAPAVVASQNLPSEQNFLINPPPADSSGNPALALVIFNTGQAELLATPH
jgi:hypothetical protein